MGEKRGEGAARGRVSTNWANTIHCRWLTGGYAHASVCRLREAYDLLLTIGVLPAMYDKCLEKHLGAPLAIIRRSVRSESHEPGPHLSR